MKENQVIGIAQEGRYYNRLRIVLIHNVIYNNHDSNRKTNTENPSFQPGPEGKNSTSSTKSSSPGHLAPRPQEVPALALARSNYEQECLTATYPHRLWAHQDKILTADFLFF